MAAKPDKTREDLEQEITCPLCLGTFEDPRVLSCQHVYCKSCLENLASRAGNMSITCPECRKVSPMLAGGVSGLPVAFQINRLKALVARMGLEEVGAAPLGTCETDGSETGPPEHGGASKCVQHPSQSLDLYCHQCEAFACRDCIVFDRKHVDHHYSKVEVVANEFREEIKQKLTSFQKESAVEEALVAVTAAHKSVVESRKIISGKIVVSYDTAIRAMQEEKQKAIEKVKQETDIKLKEIVKHEAAITTTLSDSHTVQSSVWHMVGRLGDVDFLSRKKEVTLQIDRLKKSGDNLPKIQSDIAGIKGEMLVAHKWPVQIYEVFDLLCSAVEISKSACRVNESSRAVITLRDSCNDPCPLKQSVMVELRSARFGHTVTADIITRSSSSYEARYTPTLRTRGHCQLLVTVGGRMIGREPIEVFVECPPQLLGEPVHILENGINKPGYLGIVGNIMFCKLSRNIFTIDFQKSESCPTHFPVFPKGTAQWRPSEIVVAEHCHSLFVSDSYNGKVHKFRSTDGEYIKSIGGKGSLPGEFDRPNGLCVSNRSHLYVCDSKNHRIQVFNLDLKFVRCFGSYGSKPGQFNWPDNVAIDSSGQLYVTDYRNHRIQCLTNMGTPIACIGKEGNGPGEFFKPNILRIAGNYMYVTDRRAVSIFTTSGQFITRFAGICAANELNGLAIDKNGFVFVSDYSGDRILVF